MKSVSKFLLSYAEKDSYIAILMSKLNTLRTQAGVSQEEFANLVGVSKQTYSAIERKLRRMSWSIYLCLVLFYDHHLKTHKMFQLLPLFPESLIVRYNGEENVM